MAIFVGREKEYLQLEGAISNKINFPYVLVHGAPSTGKTSVLESVIKKKEIHHVSVPCRLVHTQKQLFDIILNGISNYFDWNEEKKETNKKEYGMWRSSSTFKDCTNATTFAHIIGEENPTCGAPFYIILDHFEHLYDIDKSLLTCMQSLFNLLGEEREREIKYIHIYIYIYRMYRRVCRIGFILVGHTSSLLMLDALVGRKYNTLMAVHFPQYTDQQLLTILSAQSQSLTVNSKTTCPVTKLASFNKLREGVVQLLVQTFSIYTRRVDQLDHLLVHLISHLVRLQDDLMENKITEESLLSKMQEYVSQLLTCMSSNEMGLDFLEVLETKDLAEQIKKRNNQTPPDLPYASKILLLAAYLASYNTPEFNEFQFVNQENPKKRKKKKLFIQENKFDGRSNKQINKTKQNKTKNLRVEGSNVQDGRKNPNLKAIHDLRSQIAHLISLSFLSKITAANELDEIKLKCNISHDYAEYLAKILKIDLKNFLQDKV
ncbi:origin recognition complex subunit 5-like protein [Reticulomyxa filosa]|uniref:Origin recognition complex subunit 5-like protein n=1 Tax=Reticulomyxa filosa TaxID=46433 RepID=X6ND95_RETFI|nr:origin recognition complex subunit 5-like protein [Reticulomyxa filosa]|eukprot:ETO23297.1 origin recognition complex subunit 5-like protein [Reticulomyxa filosa]